MVQRITVIVDTDIYFSALYNPTGNEGRVLAAAGKGAILLISPDTVQEELQRNLVQKLGYPPQEAAATLHLLPTIWMPKVEYNKHLPEARRLLSRPEDSPLLAAALTLRAMLLTGDRKHFDRAVVRQKVKIITSRELLKLLHKLAPVPSHGE